MIKLHPLPDVEHKCPFCEIKLNLKGWYIPGMRNLADLHCPKCGKEFFGDLLAGQALYTPLLIEKSSGQVFDNYKVTWFADWLRTSYVNQVNEPIEFKVEEFRPLKNGILLNCLDTLYGHSLLKLLNAQYYLDHYPNLDLIVLIPQFLRWLVPDGVAAIWTVDLPLKRGIEWNEWLANKIHQSIEKLEECYLSVAFSHPHPADFSIFRYSRIDPFPLNQWSERLDEPTVTYIWREDRLWSDSLSSKIAKYLFASKHWIDQKSGTNLVGVKEQQNKVISLARELKKQFPNINFAVAGFGRSGGLPNWIHDLRVSKIDERIEHKLCQRFADSHVVIGIHGSNMILPSAHAGSVIELMPEDRWGNMIQDLAFQSADFREILYRYRIVPLSITPEKLSTVAVSLLSSWDNMHLSMAPAFCSHNITNIYSLSKRRQKGL